MSRTRYARSGTLRIAYELRGTMHRRRPWLVLIQGMGLDRSGPGEPELVVGVGGYASGPVVLAFCKVSCPICQLAFPFIQRIHQFYGDSNARIYAAGPVFICSPVLQHLTNVLPWLLLCPLEHDN